MKLNAIFAKDVQRPIEGVIKADDTAHLGDEVDEYGTVQHQEHARHSTCWTGRSLVCIASE